MTLPDELLKTDVLGRVRVKKARRDVLLDEFERGGTSAQAFAKMVGIKYQTFASWVQKRRRARKQYPPVAKVQALPSPPTTAGALRLVEALVEPAVTNAGGEFARPSAGRGGSEGPRCPAGGARRRVAPGADRRTLMLSFTGGLKVFIALEPCDLRKSFNGLHALVSERLGEDPRQGGLFVFTNRRKTRLKILYWDGTGLWVLIKRLEEGSFAWPKSVDPAAVKLRLAPEALAMLTDGIELRGARLRPWYERE